MIRFITRWALTKGILEVDGDYSPDGKKFMARPPHHLVVDRDYAFTLLTQAESVARTMAKSEIIELQKEIKRLESFKPKIVRMEKK